MAIRDFFNGGSEGEALPDQRNTGDTADNRNRWIHDRGEIGANAGAADDAPVVRFTAQRLLQGQTRLDGRARCRDRWRQPQISLTGPGALEGVLRHDHGATGQPRALATVALITRQAKQCLGSADAPAAYC